MARVTNTSGRLKRGYKEPVAIAVSSLPERRKVVFLPNFCSGFEVYLQRSRITITANSQYDKAVHRDDYFCPAPFTYSSTSSAWPSGFTG